MAEITLTGLSIWDCPTGADHLGGSSGAVCPGGKIGQPLSLHLASTRGVPPQRDADPEVSQAMVMPCQRASPFGQILTPRSWDKIN